VSIDVILLGVWEDGHPRVGRRYRSGCGVRLGLARAVAKRLVIVVIDDLELSTRTRVVSGVDGRRTLAVGRKRGPAPNVAGKTVVVDDGVATGSTVRACLQQLRDDDAGRIVLAVPVGPPEMVRELEAIADEVVCLETPRRFMGVGQFYDRFDQVSDEEAMAYLERGS
jgi:predicted phosphoribosyltransferase